MITSLHNISIYVLNLENALKFYVERLGFQVHTDIMIGDDNKWASVCPPGRTESQLMLIPVEEGSIFNREQVAKMRELIKHEVFSYGVFRCNDLQTTFQILRSRGVKFLMEPGEGFLGQYEASFADDSGNWFRITEDPHAV
ncbi:MAG: VOC family protein [Flavitalea sp.]